MLLTDQDGLHRADPRKDPTARAGARARVRRSRARGDGRRARERLGRGGMLTKVLAREARCAQRRVDRDRQRPRGRRAHAARRRRGDRHRAASPTRMTLGARASNGSPTTCSSRAASRWTPARCARSSRDGKSLLPIGVVAGSGEFERGELVGCCDPDGREIARGLVNYSAAGNAAHPAQALGRDRGAARATSTSPS